MSQIIKKKIIIEKYMGNKLKILILIFIAVISIGKVSAQIKEDSLEYVKVDKSFVSLKKVNSDEVRLKYIGIKLRELLLNSNFNYNAEHSLTTRNGFLLGWYFKLNDYWKINVYFEKKILKENDNVYLNNLKLNSVKNKKIRRIEIVKQRFE